MSSVTFPGGAGGATYTDDTNPVTGLGGGGHRTKFIPALKAVVDTLALAVAEANLSQTKAAEAMQSAQDAQLYAVEGIVNLGVVSGTQVLNMDWGTIFIAHATGNCAWTVINPKAALTGITLRLTNGGLVGQTFFSANAVACKFPGHYIPALTPSGTDELEFFSIDGWQTMSGGVSRRDIG
jgi:hypothetical protein